MSYDELRRRAKANPRLIAQLVALQCTLEHFQVQEQFRKVMADSLLRFRIVKDRDLRLDCNDKKLMKLVEMDAYFTQLINNRVRIPA